MLKKPINPAGHSYSVDVPDQCPLCHRYGDTQVVAAYAAKGILGVQVVFRCAFPECGRLFIGTYGAPNLTQLISLAPAEPDPRRFPDSLAKVSPTFVNVYKEAAIAQHSNLGQVAGPGFRKAFEFLVKDYVKSMSPPEQHPTIERSPLGTVIEDLIEDPRIKGLAKRATWLGNDEVHYLRKWEGKDLGDLLTLIDLTVYWIESERLSKHYQSEMPEG